MIKKLLALLLLFFVFNAKSTHVVSADLTYECLGGLTYEFKLKFYRDCAGQATGFYQAVDYSSVSKSFSNAFLLLQDTSYEVSQVCDSLIPYTSCNSGTLPGIQIYIYSAIVTLPDSASDWVFESTICCRSTSITNLSSGFDFHTRTTLNNLDGKCNNSPTFSAIPLVYACANEVVSFNNIALDSEGDSLSYKLVRTMGGRGIIIPYSPTTYTANNPFATTSGITFDSITGQITFHTTSLQQAILTVLITEYDSLGTVKGTQLRDIQFIFINCPPPPFNPYVTGINYDTINYSYSGCYNMPVSFDVFSVSFDTISPIELHYFSNNIPNGTFTTTVNKDTTFGTFTWIPGNSIGNFDFTIQAIAKTCPLKRQNFFNYTLRIDTFFSSCKDTTLYLPPSGFLTIDSSFVLELNKKGMCSIQKVVLSKDTFHCYELGVNPVTVTTHYDNGMVRSCTANVTIIDTLVPSFVCLDTTIYLNSLGLATIDSSYLVGNVVSNSCNLIEFSMSRDTFWCKDIGANSVTTQAVYTFSSNSDSCNSIVTVMDTISPTAICRNNTFYLNSQGKVTIDSSSINNGIFDNCGVATFVLNKYNFDCGDVGNNTVVMTVTDINGNSSSCSSTIAILDTLAPIVFCRDTIVYLTSSGTVSIDSTFVNDGSTDSCGIASIMLSNTMFDCSHLGINTITMTVEDASGNRDSCSALVTVLDTASATINCNNISVYLNTLGIAQIDSSDIYSGSSSNCGIATITISDSIFDCNNIGINNVTMIVTDVNGNIDSCVALVTVLDTLNPTILCNDTTIYINNLGFSIIDTSFVHSGSFDNCTIDSIWLSQSTFTCNELGANTIQLYANDNSGNVDSCSAIVTVLDTIIPISYAGIDTTICGSSTINMTADTTLLYQSGTWSFVSPAPSVPVFANINDAKTTVSNLAVGNYQFVWSVTNGTGCKVSRDTVLITILNPLSSDAGLDISICNSFTTNLSAVSPSSSISYGTWAVVPGSPTIPFIANPSSETSGISNLSFGSYQFVWSVNNGYCNTAYDTVLVDVFELPISNAGPDQDLCAIYSTPLSGNSPNGRASGVWSVLSSSNPSIPVFTDSSVFNTTIYGLQEGTYSLLWTVSNGNCMPELDTMIINVYQSPTSFAGIDTVLCTGDSLQLYAVAPTGTSSGVWRAIPNGLPLAPYFEDSSIYNSKVYNLNAGSTHLLTWTVSNGNCPVAIDTIQVAIAGGTIVDAGRDTSICSNYSVSLNAVPISLPSVGYWYVDSSSAPNFPTFANRFSASTSVSGLIEGTYHFIWRGVNLPCLDERDTVQVSIFSQHTASAGPDQMLCNQSQTILTGNAVSGTASPSWILGPHTPNVPTFTASTSTTTLNGLVQGGSYSMIWEIQNGICPVSRDTVIISNQLTPVANYVQDKQEICQDEAVTFASISSVALPEFITAEVWTVNGNNYAGSTITEQFSNSGYYQLRLIVVTNNGCLDTIIKDSAVLVHENPIADFSINYEPNTIEIDVSDMAQFATNYVYSFGDGLSSTNSNPTHTYKDTGEYIVWQFVTNDFGCIDSIARGIYIQYLSAFVPSAFTPNKDGLNDVFLPSVSGESSDKYEFTIYDKWGQKLFSTTTNGEGWDGTYKGEIVMSGVYVWTLTTRPKVGSKTYSKKGHVTLIR